MAARTPRTPEELASTLFRAGSLATIRAPSGPLGCVTSDSASSQGRDPSWTWFVTQTASISASASPRLLGPDAGEEVQRQGRSQDREQEED